VAKLLLTSKADVDAKNNKGETALRHAARNGYEDVVELLLQHGCRESPKPDVADDRSAAMESLRKAAEEGDLKRVTTQLKYNSDLVVSKDYNGWTPLHYAVLRGKRDLAEFLLASKADVNAKESDYAKTSLHFAAEEGHQEVAKLLLASKADVNARNNIDATPLHFAALKGHNDVAKLLLACGADINAKESKYGQTPLQLAATGATRTLRNCCAGTTKCFQGRCALRIKNHSQILHQMIPTG
jgi:ankyrin repeat protein